MSCPFTSNGQSIGGSASASILPMNIQDWVPLRLTGWISLQSKKLSRVFSNTTVQSISSLVLSLLYGITLTSTNDYWKNHSLDYTALGWLSRFVIAFLPRSKHLLIPWLQSPSAVFLEPKEIKSLTASIVSPSICHKVMGPDRVFLINQKCFQEVREMLGSRKRGSLLTSHDG